MPKGREDLTGRMFGRWKVIGPAEDYIRPDEYHEPQWLCECSCGYTGVYWNKANKKWCSNIRVNNKPIYLGSFDLIEDAVKSRKEAEQKYFGEFSPQNIAI